MTTRALEDSELKAIFDNIEGCNAIRNRTMFILAIGMALRASELVGLKVGDVIDNNGNVKKYVTIRGETAKFDKERTIRISNEIQETIAEFIRWKRENMESIESCSALFVSQRRGHLTRQGFFDLVKRVFSGAGIEQSCHALRKTGATLFYIESDYDLVATQQFLGHSDPSTTRKYIGLTTEQVIKYAEKMSNHLFSAIREGKIETLDTNYNTSRDDIKNASTNDMIVELQMRGLDVYSIIEQLQDEREKEKKVIKFPVASS